jgi:hypothetical protein
VLIEVDPTLGFTSVFGADPTLEHRRILVNLAFYEKARYSCVGMQEDCKDKLTWGPERYAELPAPPKLLPTISVPPLWPSLFKGLGLGILLSIAIFVVGSCCIYTPVNLIVSAVKSDEAQSRLESQLAGSWVPDPDARVRPLNFDAKYHRLQVVWDEKHPEGIASFEVSGPDGDSLLFYITPPGRPPYLKGRITFVDPDHIDIDSGGNSLLNGRYTRANASLAKTPQQREPIKTGGNGDPLWLRILAVLIFFGGLFGWILPLAVCMFPYFKAISENGSRPMENERRQWEYESDCAAALKKAGGAKARADYNLSLEIRKLDGEIRTATVAINQLRKLVHK